MQDLRLPQTARRVTGWTNVIVLGGLAMTGIVFADNNQWGAAALAYLLLGVMVYLLGTAAYRLSVKGSGVIEAHSLLGLRKVDLRDGFKVKRAVYGSGIVVLRAGKHRVRVNGGLGRPGAVEQWLTTAATQPTPAMTTNPAG